MGTQVPFFKTCMAVIIAILLLVLFLEVKAHATSMTLDELLATDDADFAKIEREIDRRRLIERECDCTIVNGVKIHGYPGAWSARNRRLREDDIDININGTINHGY